jgi:hypothetical protein
MVLDHWHLVATGDAEVRWPNAGMAAICLLRGFLNAPTTFAVVFVFLTALCRSLGSSSALIDFLCSSPLSNPTKKQFKMATQRLGSILSHLSGGKSGVAAM